MTGNEKHEDHSGHHEMNSNPSIYTCPMYLEVNSTSRGTCPICGMKLVLVTKTDGGVGSSRACDQARFTDVPPFEFQFLRSKVLRVLWPYSRGQSARE